MDEFLDLRQLQEASQKYQDQLESLPFPDSVENFFHKLEASFSADLLSLIVTNKAQPFSGHNTYYMLRLSSSSIELLELSSSIKNNIKLTFKPVEIFLNQQKMGASYSRAFTRRLREILSDVKQHRAFIFEEHTR